MKQLCSSPAAERVGIGETSSEAVHVAVGRSPEKTLRLLEWTFRRFSCREIVLVHIHQPSSTIPTLLGKLPADQANEELVSAHRLEEWKNTQKLLLRYLNICYKSKVQPKVILVEAEHISKGIVYVVNKHAIRKLVMGASPNKCFKVKGRFSKAIYVAKNAPFCEICFVHKGKLVLMREAIDSSETVPSETIPTNSSEASRLPEANKFREELEELIAATKLKQNVLVNQKEEIAKELRSTMKNVAILDGRLHEYIHRQDEATIQIDSIMSSIAKLELENKKIQHQRDEYVQQIERLRCNHHRKSKLCNKFIGLGSNSLDFKEFSLSDLQTATFGFSDTLMIEQGGNGCVYKGEMLSRSVAIKKFHHHSVQGQREFQQEVFVLSKLRHPNLVTLIGACPEASSLVYEYLPNGNLHDRIIRKNMSPSLAWTTRVRIIHEISCALLFLHSSKPEKVVHGDLKPTNIFLDSNLSCRISGFGFCELLSDRVAAGPSLLLRQSSVPKNFCGEFPYADPEYQRSGVLTSKSDVYSLGVMVLQLLTGRTPIGLATEVRRAVLSHRLSDLLDSSAGEWPMNVAQKLAGFGLKCAEPCGHDRPELTPAVVRELKLLHSNQERPAPTSFLCPILKEIMYEPVVAADGFTYEEIAIREWFDNGRETSPMTNLGLENLNLFPNNALKFAIQDWLC